MIYKRTQAHVALACAFALGTSGVAFAQSSDETTQEQLDASYQAATELLPPEARPGECYARVFIPAETKRVENKVLVKEATEKWEVIPAQYEEVEETVEIQGEFEELEIVPAKFETQFETVIVEPEREEQIVVDAVYEEVEEKVKVRDAYTTWKKGEGPIQRYDEATGEIMCLVTVPAEYKTVTVRKLVEPAEVKKVEIPAQYETVYEVQKGGPGKMEWRPILCSTNASVELIRELQLALKEKGFNPGTVDGVLGGGTMEAVRRYQRSKGIAQGQLTIEVMRELGVEPAINVDTST